MLTKQSEKVFIGMPNWRESSGSALACGRLVSWFPSAINYAGLPEKLIDVILIE